MESMMLKNKNAGSAGRFCHRFAALGMALLLALGCLFFTDRFPVALGVSAAVSNNRHANDYANYTNVVKSYLYVDNSGYLTRVEYIPQTKSSAAVLVTEKYDASFRLISQKKIAPELGLFGGFYHSASGNYVVYGNNNEQQNDRLEVVRIIKYSEDMRRLDSVSVYGANTVHPFVGGVVRFAESNGYLHIYTCHEMYAASDGKNHQANMFFTVRESDMTLTYQRYQVSNPARGYVSHSFNQFIDLDSSTDSIITADHGDAYPRAVVLYRYAGSAGSPTLGSLERLDLVDIAGTVGDNYTGLNLGGMLVTQSGYLTAYSSVIQDEQAKSRIEKNVYVSYVPAGSFQKESVRTVRLTNYESGSRYYAGTPYLIDCENGHYLVLWTQYIINQWGQKNVDKTYGVLIAEDGTALSPVCAVNGNLSDCKPIFANDRIVWYTTDNSVPAFTALSEGDFSTGSSACTHSYAQTVLTAPTCQTGGQALYTCVFCGTSYTDILAPIDHVDDDDNGLCDMCGTRVTAKSTRIRSEKPYYTTADRTAVFTLTSDTGVTLAKAEMPNSAYSYRITIDGYTRTSACTFQLYTSKNGVAVPLYQEGTYDILFTLSDGTILGAKLIISNTPPTTVPPTTVPPTTVPPTTVPPTTVPPTTVPPTTVPPTTVPPTTEPPTTEPPITEPPITEPPITEPTITEPTTTEPPTTVPPTTVPPTTEPPTTVPPTTVPPTTVSPTTVPPTTVPPTTVPPTTVPTTPTGKIGDLNRDGKINSSDARLILRLAAHLDPLTDDIKPIADVDGNGKVNSADARRVLRFAAHLDDTLTP